MSVRLLSSLREPPQVGRYYLVQTVRGYNWCGLDGDWPVIGPLHDDKEFFNFPHRHYHIDPRFLTARQRRLAEFKGRWLMASDPAAATCNPVVRATSGYPLYCRDELPKGRPDLVRRRCWRADFSIYPAPTAKAVKQLREKFEGARPIVLSDGRMLCPHRKADISSVAPDVDGFVTCPLHGLRLRCVA